MKNMMLAALAALSLAAAVAPAANAAVFHNGSTDCRRCRCNPYAADRHVWWRLNQIGSVKGLLPQDLLAFLDG